MPQTVINSPAGRNRLGAENSPYLLQHKDNPVHWMPWGDEALSLARQSGRPILLSVGYAACHWCHVMAHESFEDQETADVMNDLFINIKLDREERPDIDAIYQQALALMGEHGGWPLTMFLTPDGHPFWGGTYFPREARFGRPAFKAVLQRLAEIYVQEPDKVQQNVTALRDALGKLAQNQPGAALSVEQLDALAERLLQQVDTVHGGIGSAPKFPQTPIFEYLWRAYKRSGQTALRDAVCITLDRMCQGGIYDHLGGGFARYSVDPFWLVPHFEKMLYDNAQLIDLLTLVWQETRTPLYAQRVDETIAWLLREMTVPGGGFAGTLDADSEGEEGRFYVWSAEQVDAVLGEDAAAFKAAYDVAPAGNWEGRTILNRSKQPQLGDDAHEALLARCRGRLLAERDRRVRPATDDKVLADWNGLMIAALANAAAVFERPDWHQAADRAFRFVCEQMSADGRLLHSWREGRVAHPATLDDYAYLCRAALILYEATGEAAYLERCRAWLDVVEEHYRDASEGGYFLSADDVTDVITRPKSIYDAATPAGNGVLLGVFGRLYHLLGEDAWRDRAERLLAAFAGEVGRNAFAMTTFLNSAEFLHGALQIVLCEADDADRRDALLRVVHGASLPNRVLTVVPAGATPPQGHPAAGKSAVDGRATAYVCRGQSCSLPITDADSLSRALRAA